MTLPGAGLSLAVLGAGLATRFGSDKLAVLLEGKPLVHHVLEAVDGFAWEQRLLVCRGTPGWAQAFADKGFTLIDNTEPERGLRGSLLAAAAHVPTGGRMMVCLADMPRITAAHLQRLIAAAGRWRGAVASGAGAYRGPPAIIPVDDLQALPRKGDSGARALLSAARLVTAEPGILADVDTGEDLQRISAGPPGPDTFR